MDKQEFLLLIPGIIYGVAIVDLIKIVQHRVNYWEVVFWGVLLMITIINHWISLYQKLGAIVDSNLNFYLIIGQAMVYAQAAYTITPNEKDEDTEQYFHKIRKNFFLIILVTVLVNLLLQFVVFNDRMLWIRLTNIPLILTCILVNKKWVRTTIGLYFVTLTIVLLFFD